MKPMHIALAVLVAVIWGIAFVVSKIGLESFSPPQLTALRFTIAAMAALWLPRPPISWTSLIAIGLTMFAGQFLLQFFGMANGMPPGLTAVVVQTQAIFTVLFAALALGDKPSVAQVVGMLTAFIGLIMIGATLGGGISVTAFALTLASALSWALGNVLVKRLPKIDMLQLMVWASLVPPLPALAISFALDGPGSLPRAVAGASWLGIVAPVYLGLVSTGPSLFGLGAFDAAIFGWGGGALRVAGARRRGAGIGVDLWRELRSPSARRHGLHADGRGHRGVAAQECAHCAINRGKGRCRGSDRMRAVIWCDGRVANEACPPESRR